MSKEIQECEENEGYADEEGVEEEVLKPEEKKKGMCKCPEGSPQKGDKDPVVLAWHKKYRKDLYVSKGMEAYVEKNKIKLP